MLRKRWAHYHVVGSQIVAERICRVLALSDVSLDLTGSRLLSLTCHSLIKMCVLLSKRCWSLALTIDAVLFLDLFDAIFLGELRLYSLLYYDILVALFLYDFWLLDLGGPCLYG